MTLVERVATDLHRARRTLLTMPYLADATQFIGAIVAGLVVLAALGSIVPRFGWLAWLTGGATALALAGRHLWPSWRRRQDDRRAVTALSSLAGADLRGRELASIRLYNRDLVGTALDGTNLTHAVLTGATLDRASLSGANLSYGSLNVSHCTEATFVGARLFGVRFDRGWARRASFDGADLRHASFVETDLRGATFEGADVRAADFSEARLDPTALDGALTSSTTILPDGDLGTDAVEPLAVRWRQGTALAARFGSTPAVRQVALGTVAALVVAGSTAVVEARTSDPSNRVAAGSAETVEETAAVVVGIDGTPTTLRPLPRAVDDRPSPAVAPTGRPDATPDRSGDDPPPPPRQEPPAEPGEISGGGGAPSGEDDGPGAIDELSPVEVEPGAEGDAGLGQPTELREGVEPMLDDTEAAAVEEDGDQRSGAETGQPPPPDQLPDRAAASTAGATTGVWLIVTSAGGTATATVRSALGEGTVSVGPDQPLQLEVPPIGPLAVTVVPDGNLSAASCSVVIDGIERLGRLGRPGQPVNCELDLDLAMGSGPGTTG